jgi:type II secretory pathway component PulF
MDMFESGLPQQRLRMPPLSLALRARVFAELALMEAAGFPAVRAFETLRATPEAALSAACAAMIKALQRGLPLATAGQQAGLFSALDGVLVAAGSEGGQLEAIYRRLAQRYLDLANHRRRVRSQLALPLAVMTLGIFISPLPALARDELSLTDYVLGGLWQLGLLGVALRLGLKLLEGLANPRPGWAALDLVLWHLPVLGGLIRQRNAARFLETLGLLLEAGLPALPALKQSLTVLSNTVARRQLGALEQGLKTGMTWQAALGRQSVLEAQVQHLLATGEAAGRLPEMVLRCAAQLREENRRLGAALATWGPRVVYLLVLVMFGVGMVRGR